MQNNSETKVLFLDFDGVITCAASNYRLDAHKIELVKKIIEATNASIVISSSWRRSTLTDTITYITNTDNYYVGNTPFMHADSIIDITDRMFAFNVLEPAKHYSLPRGVEIKHWLNCHTNVKNYCILDDDCDMLLEHKHHFVQTDSILGLSSYDADRAIAILNENVPTDYYDIVRHIATSIVAEYDACPSLIKAYIDSTVFDVNKFKAEILKMTMNIIAFKSTIDTRTSKYFTDKLETWFSF